MEMERVTGGSPLGAGPKKEMMLLPRTITLPGGGGETDG